MRIWHSWASSHSMGVIVLGRFRSAATAQEAAQTLARLEQEGREGHAPEAVAAPFRERGLELHVRDALALHHLLYTRMAGWQWPFGEVTVQPGADGAVVAWRLSGEADWCPEAYELSRALGNLMLGLGADAVECDDGQGPAPWSP